MTLEGLEVKHRFFPKLRKPKASLNIIIELCFSGFSHVQTALNVLIQEDGVMDLPTARIG